MRKGWAVFLLTLGMLALFSPLISARETITLGSDPGTYIEEINSGAVATSQHQDWNKTLIDPSKNITYIWSSSQIPANERCAGSTRTFVETFKIPLNAKNITGYISINSDNFYKIYFNNQLIADRTTTGCGPTGTYWSCWTDIQRHAFTPKIGDNILKVVGVNYKSTAGPTICDTNPNDNPGGVIYRADISYDKLNPADLWIEDTSPDTGLEPNSSTAGMWMSQAIWIRNANDQVTVHQNPIAGKQNAVYVKIRNRGEIASAASGNRVEVYWANASTGLSWPGNWHLIGTAPLSSLAPNNSQTYVANLSWTPPGSGHYCMIARIVSSEDPIKPETAAVDKNVRQNNNLAWRNLNVIGPTCENASLLVQNVTCSGGGHAPTIDLLIEGTPALFSANGVDVTLDLGELFDKWQGNGAQGEDIRLFGGTKVKLLSAKAKLLAIPMHAEEVRALAFAIRVPSKFPKTTTYHLNIQQRVCGEIIGGIDYDVTPCLTECPVIELSSLEPLCLPLNGEPIAYQRALTAQGGVAPYTFTVTNGSLPNGLTLSPNGELTGTLSKQAAGKYTFEITATDALGCTGKQVYHEIEFYSCKLDFIDWTFEVNGTKYQQGNSLPGYFDRTQLEGFGDISSRYNVVGDYVTKLSVEYLLTSLAAPTALTMSEQLNGTLAEGQLLDVTLTQLNASQYKVKVDLGWSFSVTSPAEWVKLSFGLGTILTKQDGASLPYAAFLFEIPVAGSAACNGILPFSINKTTVPEPTTLMLVGLGLLGGALLVRKNMKK